MRTRELSRKPFSRPKSRTALRTPCNSASFKPPAISVFERFVVCRFVERRERVVCASAEADKKTSAARKKTGSLFKRILNCPQKLKNRFGKRVKQFFDCQSGKKVYYFFAFIQSHP